jgi:hypothetical protein
VGFLPEEAVLPIVFQRRLQSFTQLGTNWEMEKLLYHLQMIRCFLPVNHPDNPLQCPVDNRVTCRVINQPVNQVFTHPLDRHGNRLDNQPPSLRRSLLFDPVLNQRSVHLDSPRVSRLLDRVDNLVEHRLAVHLLSQLINHLRNPLPNPLHNHLHNLLDNRHRLLQAFPPHSHLTVRLDNHPLDRVFNRSLVQLLNLRLFPAGNPVGNRLTVRQHNPLDNLPVNRPINLLHGPRSNQVVSHLPSHPVAPLVNLHLGHLQNQLNNQLRNRFLYQRPNQYAFLVANRLASLPSNLLPALVINHLHDPLDNRHHFLPYSLLRSHLTVQLDNHPLFRVFNRSLVPLLNLRLFPADNPVGNHLGVPQHNPIDILPVSPPISLPHGPRSNQVASHLLNHPFAPLVALPVSHLYDLLNNQLQCQFLYQRLSQYAFLVTNRLVCLPSNLLPALVINHL